MQTAREIRASKTYDTRLRSFKKKLDLVSKLEPGEDFLHPLMRSVSFSDMETALEMTIITLGEKIPSHLRQEEHRKEA